MLGLVEVNNFTSSQEHQSVEHLVDIGVWLMDSRNDGTAVLSGEVTEDFHDVCGGERIQTGGRLIKEDQRWVSDKLDTDGGTLALTTRDTLDERATDSCVSALGELKIVDQDVDTVDFASHISGKLELSSKFKTLSYSHGLEQNIILLHIRGKRGEVANIILVLAVDHDGTSLLKIGRDLTSGEEVQEGGLTGT